MRPASLITRCIITLPAGEADISGRRGTMLTGICARHASTVGRIRGVITASLRIRTGAVTQQTATNTRKEPG